MLVRTSEKKGRLLQLDVLRGIAVLMVLGNHPVVTAENLGPFRVFAWGWYNIGGTGVDLFFVLSGFLIGGLLFNEMFERQDLDVKRFLLRRMFKIWPSFYFYIATVFVLLALRVPMTMSVSFPIKNSVFSAFKAVASNLLNIQNYLPNIRPHTWSLAVEEHFYLILPFLLIFLTRKQRAAGHIGSIKQLRWICLGLMVACTLGRHLATLNPANDFYKIMAPTHLRLDGLFFGVFLAYCARFSPDWIERVGRHRHTLLIAGLILISPMIIVEHHSALTALDGSGLSERPCSIWGMAPSSVRWSRRRSAWASWERCSAVGRLARSRSSACTVIRSISGTSIWPPRQCSISCEPGSSMGSGTPSSGSSGCRCTLSSPSLSGSC